MKTAEYAREREHAAADVALRRAPSWFRRGVNEARLRAGLDPILSVKQNQQLAAVRVVMEAAARAATAADIRRGSGGPASASRTTTLTTRPSAPRRPALRASSRGPLVTRVIIVPAGGVARAAAIGRAYDEHISPGAFGSAKALNERGHFSLLYGHEGGTLAAAGRGLRAIDGPHGGLLLEWIPQYDPLFTLPAMRAIMAAGKILPVSVGMMVRERRRSIIERGAELVTAATLLDVSLLGEPIHGKPAYPGAVAVLRMDRFRDDPADLRAHVDEAVDISLSRAAKARSSPR